MITQPRRVLLDTSVLIDYPEPEVTALADQLAVSAVSVAELYFGVFLAPDPIEQLLRLRRLRVVIDRYDVLPFDADAAEYYGTLCAALRQSGRDPRPRRMDLQIAATAARFGVTLLTRDSADFKALGKAVEVIVLPTNPAGG